MKETGKQVKQITLANKYPTGKQTNYIEACWNPFHKIFNQVNRMVYLTQIRNSGYFFQDSYSGVKVRHIVGNNLYFVGDVVSIKSENGNSIFPNQKIIEVDSFEVVSNNDIKNLKLEIYLNNDILGSIVRLEGICDITLNPKLLTLIRLLGITLEGFCSIYFKGFKGDVVSWFDYKFKTNK